ncbi:MAG TPA: hypothetical protein DCE42_26645 [Myxococcales bacterium]|nr:hypothetical protein [Deltaproteobacteria bacterium]HAA58370.1 hypothetical protein [Myxococcales bacterium]
MSEHTGFQAGTWTLGQDDGWLHLHTWKSGLLSAVGHDLLLDMKSFSLEITAEEDGHASVSLHIPKDHFEVLTPENLKDKDKRDIQNNIRKHLPSDIRFSGRANWNSETRVQVAGELQLGGRQAPITFSAEREGELLHGKMRLSHKDLGITPFRAPLGVIKLKDELDFSFRLNFSSLLLKS